ncbi:MAG: tRNA (adenosine(37)-N6)-threonylcarbamoyltransferase complex ATPase subunit type 1 TsaE [Patescibacteria group bacterium]
MRRFARILAEELLKIRPKQSLLIALSGQLGGGKTTFVQGFAKGLGIRGKVQSPTFIIQKIYRLKTKNYKLFAHIDAYRFTKPNEILALGWQGLIQNPGNIVIVEWAENIKKFLTKNRIDIKIDFVSKNKRKITINGRKN